MNNMILYRLSFSDHTCFMPRCTNLSRVRAHSDQIWRKITGGCRKVRRGAKWNEDVTLQAQTERSTPIIMVTNHLISPLNIEHTF